jgi:hypothetical protein
MWQEPTHSLLRVLRRAAATLGLGTVAWLALACDPSSHAAESPETNADPSQMQLLCEAERGSGAIALFPYSAKGEAIEAWLSSRLSHEGTRTLYYETLMQSPVHHQEAILRDAAASLGVQPCPMAGYLGFLAGMSLQATSYDSCLAACTTRNADMPRATEDCHTGCGGDLGE